jgi:hypothetical protein
MVFTVPPAPASRLLTSCMLAAVLVSASACDKNDPSPGGSDGGTVRPGSRLSWNQGATSLAQLRALTFRLYVDGAASSLSNPQCNEVATAGGYDCSGGLPTMAPGRRLLELASVLGGVESERSAPLSVTVAAAATTELGLTPVSDDAQSNPDQSTAATVCLADTASETCYGRRIVASDLQHVSLLTALPDGRALFVDGDGQLRIIANETVVSEAALRLEDSTSRIVGVAVDWDFATSRSIFVAWTSESPRGVELSITRYRELQNTLGEGATIVADLPFQGGASAPLAVDVNGLLYVALPASSSGQSGVILRYTRDGYVPRSNSSSTPTIGTGFAQPVDLAVDARTSRVWMSGDDPARPYSVATFTNVNQLASRAGATGVLDRRTTGETPSLAVLASAPAADTTSVLMTANGALMRGEFSENGALQNLRQVAIEPDLQVLAVAPQQNGSWYLLVGTADGPQSIELLKAK